MDTQQNYTEAPKITNTNALGVANELLSLQQQAWIDYKAVGGWLTDADSNVPKKMTVIELAEKLGVTRDLLYKWTKNIPSFWERVATRRKELGSQERLIKVHDTWYLKALGGSYPHLQLWLANFDPDFRMPTEKVQHDIGDGFMEALGVAQKRKQLIDGVVVDEPKVND